MATIATHNGHTAHREHNIRNPRVVSKEAHINPHGNYEIWLDIPPRKAYEELFGDAVKEYNERQTRADRKINDYYDDICKDKKKHAVYEMICGVYDENVTADTAHEILFDFVADWERRNPNLFLCGAYYHADEDGQPHVHIDYVPFVDGYTRGMSRQNGLVKALGQQGFFKRGKETAQIAWERSENAALEKICRLHGLTIEHPQRGKGVEHLHTQTYKAAQELVEARRTASEALAEVNVLRGQVDSLQSASATLSGEIADKHERLKRLSGEIVEQEQLRERTVDKTLLGKSKDTVTMPYEEYRALHHYATLQKDVKRRDEDLTNREKQLVDKEIKCEKYLDELRNASKYKNQAVKVERLEKELSETREDLQNVSVERNRLWRELKLFNVYKRAFRAFENVIEKLGKAFEIEDVLNDPDGEVSQRNRKMSRSGLGYDIIHAAWDGHRERWHYYWTDSNGAREDCLRQVYMPLVKDISNEIGSKMAQTVLDQDLFQEAQEACRQKSMYRKYDISR